MIKLTSTVIKLVYILSIIAKSITSLTFVSWVKEFFKKYYLFSINNELFIYTLLFFLILTELYIVFYMDEKKLARINNIALSFIFLCLTILAYLNGMDGDCGCFGKIIRFDNGFDKIIFNSLFFITSVLFYFLKNKSLPLKTKS